MAGRSFKVNINPKVMQWAIATSGWDDDMLAAKLHTEPQILKGWKAGEGIEFSKLKRLAKLVRRPSAVFLLPNPPKEDNPTDYRVLADGRSPKLSQKTIWAIRRARYMQSAAADMLKLDGTDPRPQIDDKISPKTPPEEAAKSERKKLGFDHGGTLRSGEVRRSDGDFYRALRNAVESLGIFVLQDSLPIEDFRGVTLSKKLPPVILINSRDAVRARIFSLLHEYGHVLLRKGGMCAPEPAFGSARGNLPGVEVWCNGFAASVLMPREEFLEEYGDLLKKHDDALDVVNSLSGKFKVSGTAAIVRIRNLGADPDRLSDLQGILDGAKNKPGRSEGDKRGGGPEPASNCISKNGMRFVSLVLKMQEEKSITNSDVIDYLGIDLKHVEKLQVKTDWA